VKIVAVDSDGKPMSADHFDLQGLESSSTERVVGSAAFAATDFVAITRSRSRLGEHHAPREKLKNAYERTRYIALGAEQSNLQYSAPRRHREPSTMFTTPSRRIDFSMIAGWK
jgi:hypothetical protein